MTTKGWFYVGLAGGIVAVLVYIFVTNKKKG